jgi:hypothetical protein
MLPQSTPTSQRAITRRHRRDVDRRIVQHRDSLDSCDDIEDDDEDDMTADLQQQLNNTRKKRFFYRTLEPPDNDEQQSSHFSSQELELLSTTIVDKTSNSNNNNSSGTLYLPPDDVSDDCSSGSSDSSGSSLSTMAELRLQQEQQAILMSQRCSSPQTTTTDHGHKNNRFIKVFVSNRRRSSSTTAEEQQRQVNYLQQYMAARHMTPTQERWNAITMLPSPLYCMYFLLSGCWVHQTMVREASGEHFNLETTSSSSSSSGFEDFINHAIGDTHGCLTHSLPWLPHNMPALPPLTVMAVAIGILCHAPFSFLYHWFYAHHLPAGAPRTTHWSRRMDQSMIHFASACMSYATSGSWDFFVANVLFNAECIYCQFKRKVRPRRNKIRIIISILAYVVPILRRGDLELFVKISVVLGISGWLFIYYPIGGWSHAAFHLVIACAPPLLMMAATELDSSQQQLKLAANCAAAAAVAAQQ